MTPEQNAIVDKWVAALRSGEYKQGKGILKEEVDGEVRHCCLGLLCEVLGVDNRRDGNFWVFDDRSRVLPEIASRECGLQSCDGDCAWGPLTELNDTGSTFAQIADIIESRPEGLFVTEEQAQ